jgi:pimeloyl-ACP methyl ester carboxylesterase
MADFLLIHGSCHGAWCWRDLIPALRALGHEARAIDLPSHGDDPTPPAAFTLDLYASAIAKAVTPGTILVGHSMAGFPITTAAEVVPDLITRLIYLCAYVPMPGLSLAQMRRMAPTQPLLEAIITDSDRVTFHIDPAKATAKFFHDVDPSTARWAVAQLGPQPILPQETPLWPDRALGLPSSYIRTTDDRAIPPAFQVTMTKGWPADSIHELPTSHSPFLSAPARLARLLDRIAKG